MLSLNLNHWGRETHICVGNLTIIGSDNSLSPGRRQAIILTSAGILLMGALRTNFSGMSIAIQTFSYKKIHLKVSSVKWRPFCLGLNVLSESGTTQHPWRPCVKQHLACSPKFKTVTSDHFNLILIDSHFKENTNWDGASCNPCTNVNWCRSINSYSVFQLYRLFLPNELQ